MKWDEIGQCWVAETRVWHHGWTIVAVWYFKPGVQRVMIRRDKHYFWMQAVQHEMRVVFAKDALCPWPAPGPHEEGPL